MRASILNTDGGGLNYIIHTLTHSLRATSHTRLRARDHNTSSTLTGGVRQSRSKFASHYT